MKHAMEEMCNKVENQPGVNIKHKTLCKNTTSQIGVYTASNSSYCFCSNAYYHRKDRLAKCSLFHYKKKTSRDDSENGTCN